MFFTASAAGAMRSGLSALILLAVILGGVLMTLFVSWILSKTVLKGVPSSFALELPPYRKPQIGKVIVRSIFDRTIFVLAEPAQSPLRQDFLSGVSQTLPSAVKQFFIIFRNFYSRWGIYLEWTGLFFLDLFWDFRQMKLLYLLLLCVTCPPEQLWKWKICTHLSSCLLTTAGTGSQLFVQ